MRIRCNPEKRLVRSVGSRIGYWYCIPSPFLQVNVMKRYWSFWVELGDKRWTPAELSSDRKAAEIFKCAECGYETTDKDFDFTHVGNTGWHV